MASKNRILILLQFRLVFPGASYSFVFYGVSFQSDIHIDVSFQAKIESRLPDWYTRMR